ncbi:MAG TPA: cytochrome b [Balneolaceae bacterium]|nr:cytochrome b [Balneolaceae bacterium]|tara:strand:- start:203635 stop:204384 length:750 start_codon:yes stop_codon:yes gene_type:complete
MEKTTTYDYPTRIFHWLFALLFFVAFAIAKLLDDDSPLFSYHMMAGLSLLFVLVLRIIWGIIGTTYARFNSFKLNPKELILYGKQLLIGKTKRYLSHNPASSYAALLMFALTIGLGITGVNMALGYESEFFEEAHEIMANLFLLTVVAHVVGIIYHHFSHKDSLWSSMLDGKKRSISGESGITSNRPFIAIIFLILSFSWMGYIYSNYDQTTQTLALFGNQLQLGENEDGEHEGASYLEQRRHEDDDDD